MQRRNRPVPIVVPEETATHDFKLTDSGVFETGGIVVSKAGCIITKNEEASSRAQPLSRPASVCTDSSRPASDVSLAPEPATSSQTAAKEAQQHSTSGSTKATAPSSTPAASTAVDSSSIDSQAAIALSDLEEICVIGSGSSGVVKKVLHKPTGGVYVLKVINFDIGSEQVRRQVTTEVKALDGARHLHIVSYHQSYFINGALTILMEFLDGGSLWDVLQKVRVIPQQYLPELARQILSGLSFLHDSARICHRDIKPGNLLLSSSGQLKISDFGVSSQLSNSMSRCLSWVGTVTYMSPERIRGDSYGFNTDVWSVGLLLLECATGRYPYPPPDSAAAGAGGPPRLGFWELLEYIVVEPAPKLPPGQFSVELIDFLGYCLQKDPAKRPSAGLLLQHPFITRGPRTNLSDLLLLPQAGSSRSKAAAAAGGSIREGSGVPAVQVGGASTAGGSRSSSSSTGASSQRAGTAVARRSSSSRSSASSSGRISSAAGLAAGTAAAAGVSSTATAAAATAAVAKLSPYMNTYQSRPVSASVAAAAVVNACPTPRKQSLQQQQQASKQPSQHRILQQQQQQTPTQSAAGLQQQVRQLSPRVMQQQCTPTKVGQQQQQQQVRQQSPRLANQQLRPGLVPQQQQQQQQAKQQSPRINNQQLRPSGQTAGQQQQQSPLRPLSQPPAPTAAVAAAGGGGGANPGSAGPLTALKPKTTPRKTPRATGPNKQL